MAPSPYVRPMLKTHIPIIGVPVKTKSLEGKDSLLSIVQMPAGIPVATVAIGKAGSKINLNKLSIKFGAITIVEGGKLDQSYDEKQTANYMKGENIEINIETFTGKKNFTAYTMDLTKKYIEINADYRS